VSASYLFADRWVAFARFGYSDGDGGVLLEYATSIGTGYYMRQKADVIRQALSWRNSQFNPEGNVIVVFGVSARLVL